MMASPEGVATPFDLITVGDSVVDIFTFPDKADVHCQLHGGESCELCLSAADKVPTKGFSISFGGNAANVAVGAARLGVRVSTHTHVGNDLFGREILDNFKKEGVDTSEVVVDDKEPTNVNIVLSFEGERTILTHHQPRRYTVPPFHSPWVYFSSLAPNHEYFHEPFLKYVKESRVKLVFNPGSYQIKEGLKAYGELLRVTEAFIVNREEAGRLLGTDSAQKSEAELLKGLLALGPKRVVVTDGPHGSYGYEGGEVIYQPTTGKKAKERTGAGDAFSAGFTAALILGKDLKEALKWGTLNGESVTQEVGAQNGLLGRKELEKKVGKLK
ncbi:MAG: carbohydrate kinase family protein [Patescibacteria group bacterium]